MASRKLIVEVVGDASSLERTFRKTTRSANQFGRTLNRSAGRGFTRNLRGASAALVGGAGIAAAFTSTINRAASFEQSLNVLQAVSGATAQQMSQISAVAVKLGADLTLPATSAKDAAEAMTELAKGGLSVQDTMDAARGTLQLAAAAHITAAEAAEIGARQLNAFQLSGREAGRVADALANLANVATGEIGDFALAFQQSSAVANQFGLSLEEAGAALAVLANRGIVGSDAGTSLRVMLTRLVPATTKAAETMKALGITWKDSQGNIRPFRDLLEQYHDALTRLPPAQRQLAVQTIFGQDAQRAANIIFGNSVEVFDRMEAAVSRQGAAARLAAAQNKGFTGAMDALKSAIETVQITLGAALLPTLSALARRLAGWLGDTQNLANLQAQFNSVVNAFVTVAGAASGIAQRFADTVGGWKEALTIVIGAWAGFKLAGITSATAIQVANVAAAAGTAAAWKAALISTGWGAFAVAAGIAAAEIIAHWEAVKRWFQGFWLWLQAGFDRTLLLILEPWTHIADVGFLPGPLGALSRLGEAARALKSDLEADVQALEALAVKGAQIQGVTPRRMAPGVPPTGMPPLPTARGGAAATGGLRGGLAPDPTASKIKQTARDITATPWLTYRLALAEGTKTLRDDLAMVTRIFGVLVARFGSAKTLKERTDLLQAINSYRDQAEGLARDIRDANKAIAQAERERRKAERERERKAAARRRQRQLTLEQTAQFRLLGLGPTGGEAVPGVRQLRRQVDALQGRQGLSKIQRALLAKVERILSGGFGKVGTDVRQAILQILQDLRAALASTVRDVTSATTDVATETVRRASGPAVALLPAAFGGVGAHPGAFTPAMAGAAGRPSFVINGGLNLYGVQDVPALESELMKRAQTRPQPRRGF